MKKRKRKTGGRRNQHENENGIESARQTRRSGAEPAKRRQASKRIKRGHQQANDNQRGKKKQNIENENIIKRRRKSKHRRGKSIKMKGEEIERA